MFRKISHLTGVQDDQEILFSTQFDYFFPEAARSRLCLLPVSLETVLALRELGTAMAQPGDTADQPLDSQIPAIFTYFGQFVDHDVTARTDRETGASFLGRNEPIAPRDPDEVVATLRNGRRPQLDLDSVFGDGPGLVGGVTTQSQILFDTDLRMKLFETGTRRDLARDQNRAAIIPDARNDENVIISQLQFAFIRFFNAIYAEQPAASSAKAKFIRARQLTRWAYQLVVVQDYLKTVCDPDVVEDTLANGPRFVSSTAGRPTFMPLEFSTAAFRFGHTMIRPSYKLNGDIDPIDVMGLLGFAAKDAFFDAGDIQLKQARQVDWELFIGQLPKVQRARRLDTRIARGLGMLPFEGRSTDPVLSHLARSNLLRGYSLSIPIGQAMCDAFGIHPLTPDEIVTGEAPEIREVIERAWFHHRSPLWYYILREAAVQQGGQRLGELGSRLVAETLIGLIKQDPNSYLNNRADPAVKMDSIKVRDNAGLVEDLRDILRIGDVI